MEHTFIHLYFSLLLRGNASLKIISSPIPFPYTTREAESDTFSLPSTQYSNTYIFVCTLFFGTELLHSQHRKPFRSPPSHTPGVAKSVFFISLGTVFEHVYLRLYSFSLTRSRFTQNQVLSDSLPLLSRPGKLSPTIFLPLNRFPTRQTYIYICLTHKVLGADAIVP